MPGPKSTLVSLEESLTFPKSHLKPWRLERGTCLGLT